MQLTLDMFFLNIVHLLGRADRLIICIVSSKGYIPMRGRFEQPAVRAEVNLRLHVIPPPLQSLTPNHLGMLRSDVCFMLIIDNDISLVKASRGERKFIASLKP